MKIGIVAVHGVIPQTRFGFQDEVAGQLVAALNAQQSEPAWKWTVVLPYNGVVSTTDIPTISRVHRIVDNPSNPAFEFFDVHEAFWSPIDKGRTNVMSVLNWLLTTIFAPLNDFARFREKPLKVCWDILYVALAIALAVFLMLFAAMQAAYGLQYVLCIGGTHGANMPSSVCPAPTPPRILFDWSTLFSMAALLLSPLNLVKALTPATTVALVCGLIGTYLAWQAFRSLWFLAKGIVQGRHDVVSIVSRAVAIAVLIIAAFAFISVAWATRIAGTPLRQAGLYAVVFVVAFDFGRTYLAWFVTNFFGDVQIYTTTDENSAFFILRQAILQKVESVILSVLTKSPAGVPYDRVHILAHSLGSTIAMDALLRLYNITKAPITPGSPAAALNKRDWLRIRSFVTFGTALEKTKYFFNVWAATASQEWQQWSDQIYGGIFTAERSALTWNDASYGIYWLNNWFFSDFVSDSITTYRSFLRPGQTLADSASAENDAIASAPPGQPLVARVVAENRSKFGPWPRHLETHTWYLESAWFWHPAATGDFGTLDVLLSGISADGPLPPAALPLSNSPPPMPPRGTPVSKSDLWKFKDDHVLP